MRYGLTLDKSHWTQLMPEITENPSWKHVRFVPSDNSEIPDTPGIYVFCALSPIPQDQRGERQKNLLLTNTYIPAYVGRAENLKTRFLQHCKGSKEIKYVQQCYGPWLDFWFLSLPLVNIRQAERQLIRLFGPSGNNKSGDSDSVEVELVITETKHIRSYDYNQTSED